MQHGLPFIPTYQCHRYAAAVLRVRTKCLANENNKTVVPWPLSIWFACALVTFPPFSTIYLTGMHHEHYTSITYITRLNILQLIIYMF